MWVVDTALQGPGCAAYGEKNVFDPTKIALWTIWDNDKWVVDSEVKGKMLEVTA